MYILCDVTKDQVVIIVVKISIITLDYITFTVSSLKDLHQMFEVTVEQAVVNWIWRGCTVSMSLEWFLEESTFRLKGSRWLYSVQCYQSSICHLM